MKKSWKDVSINDYFGLVDFINKQIEDGISDNDLGIYLASYLSGVGVDELMNIRYVDLLNVMSQFSWATQPVKRAAVPPISIMINGVRYNVCLDVRKMTASQFIDFNEFCKDRRKFYNNLMACMLIPEGKKYGEGYDVIALSEEIGKCVNIVDAETIWFFFLQWSRILLNITLRSLTRMMKRRMRKEKEQEKKEKMEETIKSLERLKQTLSIYGQVG